MADSQLKLDTQTTARLDCLAREHDVSLDEMVTHLIDTYEQADPPPPPDQTKSSINEIRYKGLFQQSNDAIILLNLEGAHIDCNERATELFGYSYDELMALSFRELVKPTELTHSNGILDHLIAGEKPQPYRRTFIHKDGTEVPIEVNVECIFDEAGNPLYIQSIARDMRSRLRMRHQLQEKERRFRAIFNSAYTFMGLLLPDGTLIEANQTALDFAGITEEDVINRPFWEAYWWQISEEIQQELQRAIARAARGNFIRYEVKVQGANDTIATIDFSIKPVIDEQGNVVLLVPEGRDITDRKQMESLIIESEKRNLTILDAMVEGVLMYDATGEVILANPAVETLLGLPAEQLNATTPLDPMWKMVHNDGKPVLPEEHPVTIALIEGTPQKNVVIGIKKPYNVTTWLSINAIPMFDDLGRVSGVIATFSDVTDLKHYQQQALRTAIERERVGMITKFVQSASHEFRTPLSIIQTNNYLLKRIVSEDDRITMRLDRIDTQVMRITRLVDRLLLMAKLDAIATVAPETHINIGLLLSELKEQFEPYLMNKNITLALLGHQQKYFIISQENLLLKGIEALYENAIHYSMPHSTITVTLAGDLEGISITIADQGIGIAEDDLPRITERFWRKDEAHSQEGFGLGVPIARRVIELHGGTFDVRSTVDVGTTVTVTLPVE